MPSALVDSVRRMSGQGSRHYPVRPCLPDGRIAGRPDRQSMHRIPMSERSAFLHPQHPSNIKERVLRIYSVDAVHIRMIADRNQSQRDYGSSHRKLISLHPIWRTTRLRENYAIPVPDSPDPWLSVVPFVNSPPVSGMAWPIHTADTSTCITVHVMHSHYCLEYHSLLSVRLLMNGRVQS